MTIDALPADSVRVVQAEGRYVWYAVRGTRCDERQALQAAIGV
jgi:hypothetical protein